MVEEVNASSSEVIEGNTTTASENNQDEESKTTDNVAAATTQVQQAAQNAQSSLADLDEKIAAFKAKMDDMTRAFINGFFGGGFKDPEEYQSQKQVCTAEHAAKSMIGCKRIMLLTGAGISAASGIPTFRGNDGFWKDAKKYAGEANPMEVLTSRFFNKNPMAVWEWHYDFIKLAKDKQVNQGHIAIAKFQENCLQDANVQSILVTQNIDDLHTRLIKKSQIMRQTPDPFFEPTESNRAAFTPHIYEIHGNVHYMHCSDECEAHSRVFFRGPSLEEFEKAAADAAARGESQIVDEETGESQNFCHVPTCQQCGRVMKPHCMFFDESYSEHFYRKDTVDSFLEQSDCLIVVGTALATNFAKRIVVQHLDRELPVIEVNLETSIDRGNNLQVLQKSEIALPALFNEYYRLKAASNQSQKKASATAMSSLQVQQQQQQAAAGAQGAKKSSAAKKGKKSSTSPKQTSSAKRSAAGKNFRGAAAVQPK